MPFQAAKAIAATFCWHIRWVLTPVFGYNFPEMCVHPDDPRYGKFLIPPEIVRQCTNDTNRFREEGAAYKIAGVVNPATAVTPQLPSLNSPWEPVSHHPRKSEESGYYTGGDQTERLTASPQVSPRGSTWISAWTSVNGSKSPSSSPIIHSPTFDRAANELPPLREQLREHGIYFETRPTSVPAGYYDEPVQAKRTHSEITHDDRPVGESCVPPSIASSPRSTNDARVNEPANRTGAGTELEAAKIMLKLSAVDDTLPAPKRTRRDSR